MNLELSLGGFRAHLGEAALLAMLCEVSVVILRGNADAGKQMDEISSSLGLMLVQGSLKVTHAGQ
jgi:hypothetical protein